VIVGVREIALVCTANSLFVPRVFPLALIRAK
jgi:hypothetical protein